MPTKKTVTNALSGTSRSLLWILCGLAAVVAIAIMVATIVRVVGSTMQGRPPLELIGAQQITPGSGSTSSFTSMTMVFGNVSAPVVWLASLAVIAQALTEAALAGLVVLVSWRLVHERPFRESLYRYTIVGGVVLLVGGVISQALILLANGVAVAQAYNLGAAPTWPLAGRFDLGFIGIGVLLLLIGLAFKVGARLQRDTEGLV